ncbi:PKD domain-containing protein [bacterium]|nr:PKD domain-containing protein [bacterium]
MAKNLLKLIFLLFPFLLLAQNKIEFGNPKSYKNIHFKKADFAVETEEIIKNPSADLLTLYADLEPNYLKIRVGIYLLQSLDHKTELFNSNNTKIKIYLSYSKDKKNFVKNENFYYDELIEFSGKNKTLRNSLKEKIQTQLTREFNFVELVIPHSQNLKNELATYPNEIFNNETFPISYLVTTEIAGKTIDTLKGSNQISTQTGNCAFVLHGNQGLTYTDVFRGTDGGTTFPNSSGNGFDELLAISQNYSIPANYHLSGTLISAAEWHDPTFNDWLAQGGQQGWAEIVSSALGQHIMPFLPDNLNNKSVKTQHDLINFVYNYNPSIAWIPERVWLSGGTYPDAGISDTWLGDNWTQNGIEAVILDDYIHLAGADNHKIHWMNNGNGINLRVIPIDNTFTGNVNYNAGAAWNTILSTGENGIAVYGTDWEVLAEVSGQAVSSGVENFLWLNQQLSANSSWQGAWKLSSAISSGKFNGNGITLNNGTYDLIGGFNGYGGNNNAWYTDWAGTQSPSDFHNPGWNYGNVWWNTYNNLLSSASNSISEAGWLTFMTNIHETAWHEGLGGQTSGWIHNYSAHIKNTNVYAEAAKWAANWYTNSTAAYTSDIDLDGAVEMIIYNDRIFAVFEGTGGRLCWLFAKGTDYTYSLIGNDNAYWEGTTGDYNDANHVAGLSDVFVNGNANWINESYGWTVDNGSGSVVQISMFKDGMTKRIRLEENQPYLKVRYTTPGTTYIKSGFTPDLLSLTWNPQGIQRVFAPTSAYFGQRNTGSNATVACVVGSGGASHTAEFTSTLVKGDEISGNGTFDFLLYGGYAQPNGLTSPELDALASTVVNKPLVSNIDFFAQTGILILRFDDTMNFSQTSLANIGFDTNFDNVPDFSLANSTILNTGNSQIIRIQLDQTTAGNFKNADFNNVRLLAEANSFQNTLGNGNERYFFFDGYGVWKLENISKTIDGFFDANEWDNSTILVDDPNNDSFLGASNEIETIFMDWDSLYLYLGIDGQVASNLSWLLYLDTDPNGANGQTNLSTINVWDRNAVFNSASQMKVDFQFGSYAGSNGDFWKINSLTNATQVSSVFSRTFLTGTLTGSEIAIPWNALYELGEGIVKSGATIRLVASLATQTQLSSDSAPSNTTGTNLPTINNSVIFTVDANNDGFPDGNSTSLTADFSANPTSGNLPLTVNFLSLSTAGNNPIQSWNWDFDNNGTTDATGQNPSYTYTTQGLKSVKLTIFDGVSTVTETKNDFVNVTLAGIDQSVTVTFSLDLNASCTFTNTVSEVKATGTFSNWSTGSQAVSLSDPNNDKIWTGSYTFPAGTSENQQYKFVYTSNGTTTWEDQIANRNLTINDTNSTQTLSTVFFNDVYSNFTTQQVTVNFQVDLAVVQAPFTSVSVTGNFVNWNTSAVPLTLVNGTTYSGSYVFPACSNESYLYKFTYTDGTNVFWEDQIANRTLVLNDSLPTQNLATVTFNNLVLPPTPPNSDFTASVLSGFSPLTVNFTSTSTQGTNPITSYLWDFDSNGTTDDITSITSHTFTNVGTYAVKLTVSDGTLSDFETKNITVVSQNGILQPENVTFNVNLNAFCSETIDSVFVAGSFTNWALNPLKLSDTNNDKIYTGTHTFAVGDTLNQEFKFVYYANGSTNFVWENDVPNRNLTIDTLQTNQTLATVYFNNTEPTTVTVQNVNVTFSVDFSFVSGVVTNVYLTGDFTNWNPTAIPLVSGSGNVYSGVFAFPGCSVKTRNYKFTYSNGTETVWETIGNRNFTLDDTNTSQTLPTVTFNDVLSQSKNVTFSVDLTNYCLQTIDSVFVAGTFSGWNGTKIFDANNDKIFSGNYQILAGSTLNQEYKFFCFTDGSSVVNWEDQIGNRTLNLDFANSDTTLATVFFDNVVPTVTAQTTQVYFQVLVVADSIESVFVAGTFSGWSGIELTQVSANIFADTLVFAACEPKNVEFKFLHLKNGVFVWEDSISNRNLTLVENGSLQVLPLVAFNNLSVPLEANFQASVVSGEAPLNVTFTDFSVGFPNQVTSWFWDFQNDGTTDATTQNPVFSYTQAGTFSVKLVVSNGTESDSLLKTDYVTVSLSVLPPVSDLKIQKNGNAAVLNWSAVVGATNYKIYRSLVPITEVTGLVPIDETSNTNYTDTNAVSSGKFFYVVTWEN